MKLHRDTFQQILIQNIPQAPGIQCNPGDLQGSKSGTTYLLSVRENHDYKTPTYKFDIKSEAQIKQQSRYILFLNYQDIESEPQDIILLIYIRSRKHVDFCKKILQ